MYSDTDSIKVGDPDYSSSYHSKEEIDRLVEKYKSRKARLSSVYGVMCGGPDPDGKVRSLLNIPDPWEGY